MTPAFSRCWAAICGRGDAPAPVAFRDQTAETVVGFQRIAAGGDEVQHLGEGLVLQSRIGRRGADFREQLLLLERRRAGDREDVLREHVERSGPEILGVELAVVDGVERGACLEIFEAVAGHDSAFARLVEAMVGAADALQQARRALGRAHLDDEVDVAPVDAEVEAGGRDEAAQLARRHGRLDLAPRLLRKAAVMNADRQRLVVHRPQILEDQLGKAARVAEDERGLVPLDQLHHLARGMAARNARPREFGSRGSG